MLNQNLKIVIFEGSFKTTPFINRLLEGLAKKHAVHILGFNEELESRVQGVHYIPLGDNQNKIRFLFLTLALALGSFSPSFIIATLKDLWKGDRKNIQQRNLDRQLKRIQPDIIHLQWPSLIPWVEKYLDKRSYPLVLSLRGFHINVRPFVNEDNREYLKEFLPKFSGFHGVSKQIMQGVEEIVATPYSIQKVVYTGFNLEALSFKEDYSRETPLRLIAVGRSHWIKGYDVLIKAMKELKEQKVSFHLTIVGGGHDEELLYLIHDLGLESNVTLTGRISQEEVLQKISNAHLMVISSIAEGLPNVAVEAMALGTPVITTQCGGVEELVHHDETGWLVSTYDAEAIANTILNFTLLSDETINDVRAAARKKVEEQHSMEQMVEGMEDLYQLVMDRKLKVES